MCRHPLPTETSDWGYVQQEHCLAFQAKVEISTHTDDEMISQVVLEGALLAFLTTNRP